MDGDTRGLQRPGLVDVFAALTGDERDWWDYQLFLARTVTLQSGSVYTGSEGLRNLRRDGAVPWVTTDPREALEILQTRGLAPEDDVRRAFACSKCNGRGHMLGGDPYEGDGTGSPWACPVCKGKAARGEYPLSIPDIVAWASLGIPAIMRAEELARETVVRLREWGCPQPERVVWRVGERREAFAIILPCGLAFRCNGTIGRDVIQPTDETPLASVIRLRRNEGNAFKIVWSMGLCIDSITADAVTLIVPSVGAT